MDGHRQLREHALDEIHDVLVIRIGPVALHHGEFRIVPGGDAFVAEVAVDLEDLVRQARYQRALEIEFRRDAQVHVHLQRVVMGLERLGGRTAVDRLQHGRLDFHEAVVFHEAAHARDDLRTLLEAQLRFLVGQQVEMALAVARLDVGEAVILFRHRQQRLGEHGDLMRIDRQLAALGAAHRAGHADDVAEVDHRQQRTGFLRRRVLVGEDLDLARGVMDVDEHAGIARRVDTAGDGDDVGGFGVQLQVGIFLGKLRIGDGAVEVGRIDVADLLAQEGELLGADFGHVGGEGGCCGLLFGHRVVAFSGCFCFDHPLCPAGHLPHKGGDRLGDACRSTSGVKTGGQRGLGATGRPLADLPPCGGDARQGRGGSSTRRRSSDAASSVRSTHHGRQYLARHLQPLAHDRAAEQRHRVEQR